MSVTVAPPDLRTLDRTWAARPGLTGWLGQCNHKTVGMRFIVTSFVMFLLAGALALVMRLQLAVPEGDFVGPAAFNQLFTMHGTLMMFMFVVPMLEGLAIYFLPLQLGAPEVRPAQVGACQCGMPQFGVAKILACEIPAGKVVLRQVNSRQIVGQVAGGGIKLLFGKAAGGCAPERSSSQHGSGEVCVSDPDKRKRCIGEVLPGETPAVQVVAAQSDSHQIVGLIAGRRIKLGGREGLVGIELGAPHLSACEVRVRQVHSAERRMGEVRSAEVGAR